MQLKKQSRQHKHNYLHAIKNLNDDMFVGSTGAMQKYY